VIDDRNKTISKVGWWKEQDCRQNRVLQAANLYSIDRTVRR
jgi:hypothetical protein